jgi:DNA-binding HxlR family transcriptional regulator
MRRKTFAHMNCSIAQALEVVGEWWSMLILREAFMGTRRFRDFQQNLGIARNILSARLSKLVRQGVMRRVPGPGGARHYEYRLTEKGRALFPAITALRQWADRWVMGPDKTPVRAIEIASGDDIAEVKVLNRAGRELAPFEVALVAGPGATRATCARLEAIMNARNLSQSVVRPQR